MAVQIQIRRDTTENWESEDPTLAEGELGVAIDDGVVTALKVGNGSDAWTDLAAFSGGEARLLPAPLGSAGRVPVVNDDGDGVLWGLAQGFVQGRFDGLELNEPAAFSWLVDQLAGGGDVTLEVVDGKIVISASGGGGSGVFVAYARTSGPVDLSALAEAANSAAALEAIFATSPARDEYADIGFGTDRVVLDSQEDPSENGMYDLLDEAPWLSLAETQPTVGQTVVIRYMGSADQTAPWLMQVKNGDTWGLALVNDETPGVISAVFRAAVTDRATFLATTDATLPGSIATTQGAPVIVEYDDQTADRFVRTHVPAPGEGLTMADWFTLDREVVNLEYLGSLVWAAFDLNNGFAPYERRVGLDGGGFKLVEPVISGEEFDFAAALWDSPWWQRAVQTRVIPFINAIHDGVREGGNFWTAGPGSVATTNTLDGLVFNGEGGRQGVVALINQPDGNNGFVEIINGDPTQAGQEAEVTDQLNGRWTGETGPFGPESYPLYGGTPVYIGDGDHYGNSVVVTRSDGLGGENWGLNVPSVPYAPAEPADWDDEVDPPTTTSEALDRLAARVKTLEPPA